MCLSEAMNQSLCWASKVPFGVHMLSLLVHGVILGSDCVMRPDLQICVRWIVGIWFVFVKLWYVVFWV